MLKVKRSFINHGLILHPDIDSFDGVIGLAGLGLVLGLVMSIETMDYLLVRFQQVLTAFDRFQQNPTGAKFVPQNIFSEYLGSRRLLIIVITVLSGVNPLCFRFEERCL